MDLQKLHDELASDPLGRGYASMTDAQAATALNAVNRTVDRTSVPTWEVFEATVPSEWAALSTAEKQRYQSMLGMGTLDPHGTNTRAAFAAMFAANTATRANLLALTTQTVSRAAELGLPFVGPHHVLAARAL